LINVANYNVSQEEYFMKRVLIVLVSAVLLCGCVDKNKKKLEELGNINKDLETKLSQVQYDSARKSDAITAKDAEIKRLQEKVDDLDRSMRRLEMDLVEKKTASGANAKPKADTSAAGKNHKGGKAAGGKKGKKK